MSYEYVDQNRKGDYLCYISNLSKIKAYFPKWKITKDLKEIFREIYEAWLNRGHRKGVMLGALVNGKCNDRTQQISHD